MKICLISPKGNFISNNPEFIRFWNNSEITEVYRKYWTGLSTALLIIAALTPSSYEINLIDENIEEIDFNMFYDIVAITCMTQQAIRAYEIGDIFRSNGVKVIIGGIHATVMPFEVKEHADSVVIGEAENIWPQVLKDFEKSALQPFYKNDEEVDLKKSPIPRYDLLKGKNYNVVWIQTTRGCPHNCEFCAASKIYGAKYRTKDVDQVIREIMNAKNMLGNVRFAFSDDNLFVKKDFYLPFLETLSKLNLRWVGETDISIGENKDILRLIRKSGCIFLFIGLESLSPQNLAQIDKNGWKLNRLEKYPFYLNEIQTSGIGVMGSFIFGLDDDDQSTFDKVSEFIIQNNLFNAHFSILTPYPGTQIRENFISQNRLLPTKWDNYSLWGVNFIPNKMTQEELENGFLQLQKRINNKEFFLQKIIYFKNIQKELIKTDLNIII